MATSLRVAQKDEQSLEGKFELRFMHLALSYGDGVEGLNSRLKSVFLSPSLIEGSNFGID